MAKTTSKKLLNEYLTTGLTGCIYKLSYGDDFYIGSTLRPLKKRIGDHKERHKNGNGKLYNLMREKGFDNFSVEILEKVKYNEKTQVRQREKYYYDLLKPTLNEISPYLTPEDRKVKGHIRWKKWYYTPEIHAKQLLKKTKDYHTKYRDYWREKVNCEYCGRTVCRKYLNQHQKTNYCVSYRIAQAKEDFVLEQIEDEVAEIQEQFLEEPNIIKLISRIKCDELEEVNLDDLSI